MPSGPGSVGCRRVWCKLSSWACRVLPGCSSAFARRIAGKRVWQRLRRRVRNSMAALRYAPLPDWEIGATGTKAPQLRQGHQRAGSRSCASHWATLNSRTLRLEQMRSVRAQLPVKAEFFRVLQQADQVRRRLPNLPSKGVSWAPPNTTKRLRGHPIAGKCYKTTIEVRPPGSDTSIILLLKTKP